MLGAMKDTPPKPDSDAPEARAEDVLDIYQAGALDFAATRSRTLYERRWLDRALARAPGRSVLDLGCGFGLPIDSYLIDRRCTVTGVDGAGAMLRLFERALPRAEAIHADMRGLWLDRKFDLILAWNSLYHLSPDDQRAMFETFARHAHERTVLLFTSGPDAGEGVGIVGGRPLYHASLSPQEYRGHFAENGFEEVDFVPEDPDCQGHSIWMARYVGGGLTIGL